MKVQKGVAQQRCKPCFKKGKMMLAGFELAPRKKMTGAHLLASLGQNSTHCETFPAPNVG